MFNVSDVTNMQHEMVSRWHHCEIDNPYSGLLDVACTQHSFNFQLWHEEDIARSPDVGDERVAQVKRNIDGFNQRRNDWIEKIDDWIYDHLDVPEDDLHSKIPLNTETPGSAVDRLSIMSLRIYHMKEQLERDDVDQSHLDSVRHKISVCLLQHDDLSKSLQELVDDIAAGRKRHRTYRQFKMYNDPSLNPYLYKAGA